MKSIFSVQKTQYKTVQNKDMFELTATILIIHPKNCRYRICVVNNVFYLPFTLIKIINLIIFPINAAIKTRCLKDFHISLYLNI